MLQWPLLSDECLSRSRWSLWKNKGSQALSSKISSCCLLNDQITANRWQQVATEMTQVSVDGSRFFSGSRQTVANLPGLLMNGLHSPHLGWCGKVRPACPPSSGRAVLSLGTGWMTYSVWSASPSQRKESEKATCIRENNRREEV